MGGHSSGKGRHACWGWLSPLACVCALSLACGGAGGPIAQRRPPVAAPAPTETVARAPSVPRSAAGSEKTGLPSENFPEQPGSAPGQQPAPSPADEQLTPEERALRSHLRDLEFEVLQRGPGVVEEPEEEEEEAAEEPSLLEEVTQSSIPEDYQLARSREEILQSTESELPLVLNAQVIRLINYFTGRRGIKTLRATMERAGAYRAMIERILEEEGVPRELLHLAQAESGFRPKAHSHARAAGMWQFLSSRGRQYGLHKDRYVDERQDPEKATRAAARHLLDLYGEFQDWHLAMAAYNSGPLRVRRAIQKAGSADYWTLCQRRLLPRETRNYVPIILAMTYLAKNPELYDDKAEIVPAEPLRYDTVVSDSEISLELVSDITGAPVSTLRDLNPALLRSATPPFEYRLRLPEGTGPAFQDEIALIPKEKRLQWRRHLVAEEETLEAIAKRYGVKQDQIAELNPLQDQPLTTGLRLTIPAATRLKYYHSGGAGGFLEGGSGRYRIARGDTLGGIARRFGVSVAQLRQWNRLSSSRITAGRYLVVRPQGSGSEVSTARSYGPPPSGKYTVRSGDNLSLIAKRFGVTVGDLKAWNGLRSNRIYTGKTLKVPGNRGQQAVASQRPAAGSGQYRIRSGDNLSSIADRFGVSISDLKAWNGLRSSRIRAGNYLMVRPAGAVPQETAQTRAAPSSAAPVANDVRGAETYRIRRGDNLASIAQRFDVTVDNLKAWNGLRSSRITAGDSLLVRPGRAPQGQASGAPSSPRTSPSSSIGASRYRIRRGDALATIAKRHNVTVEQLRAWNGLRSNRIHAGDYLNLGPGEAGASRGSSAVRQRAAAETSGDQYRIRQGDTLSGIATQFGVTIEQLKSWNRLRGNRIRAGNYLTVRPSSPEPGQRLAAAGGL